MRFFYDSNKLLFLRNCAIIIRVTLDLACVKTKKDKRRVYQRIYPWKKAQIHLGTKKVNTNFTIKVVLINIFEQT